MTREEAVRAYVARCAAVDRLTERATEPGNPRRADLIQLADIQARLAVAAAQIVAALTPAKTTTTEEG